MIRLALPTLLAAVALSVTPALATQLVLQSKQPYWIVGDRDDDLSRLCSLGRFNQRIDNQYVARFGGEHGEAVLGIAKGTGLNLYDPNHASKPKEDYFFLGDGTSECQVFVGGRPKKKLTPPGASKSVPVNTGPAEAAKPAPPPAPAPKPDTGASPQ
ncbi:MAG TPA: hypothetical protein VL574_08945 [Stellaceae bacterium]|jgi:hypothetical protein|nr:hypothetical protein [Stellaceae bacterium]